MKDSSKTNQELIAENSALKQKIKELRKSESEHKQTEEKLRRISSRLESLLSAIPEIIVEVDGNKVYTWANQPGMDFFGKNVIGKEAAFYFAGDQKTYDIVQPLFKGSEDTIHLESWQRRRDGEKRLLAWWCRVLKDENGQVIGVLSSARDITEQKRAEQEIAIIADIGRLISSTLEIGEVYERFAEEVRKLIPFDRIVVNLNNPSTDTRYCVYASGVDIPGRRPGDSFPLAGTVNDVLAGTRTGMIINPESAEELADRYPSLMSTFNAGLRSMMGVPLIFRDEVIGALHFRAKKPNAYTEQDLRLAERIGMQIAGAIANAQLFKDLSTTENSLRESAERFRGLVEQAAVGVAEIDMATGHFLTVNRRLCEMVGRTEGEMLATTFQAITHPDDLHLHVDKTALLLAGKIGHYSLEKRYVRKDGVIIWVNITGSLLRNPGGKPGCNMIVVEDITERKRVEEEHIVVAEIGRVIGSTLDIDSVYDRFAAEIKRLIHFDSLIVNLKRTEDTLEVAYVSGSDISGRRVGDSFQIHGILAEAVIRTRRGIIAQSDTDEDLVSRFPGLTVSIQAGLHSVMCVPLISRDEVIGSLMIRSKEYNAYSDQDLRLAERIGAHIAGAIANAQLFKDLSETERSLRKSEEEQRRLIETLPLAVFIETKGKITYVNPAFLTLFKASSPNEVIGLRLIEFVSPELYDSLEKRRKIMTQKKLILPPLELNLRCMDGTFITVVSTPMPIIFQEYPAILTALYDITERKRSEVELQKAHELLQIHSREIGDLQARLKEEAIRDPLTGLFNRRYLDETMGRELARASRDGFPIGVVMIDIDHFKEVNDSHGHKAGDLILQVMGDLLRRGIRAGDIVCRYGGEEFLIVLPQASKEITAERAEQLRASFEALRTVYGEKTLQATISLGVAIYPADGVTAEAVIHAADQAMYRSKALGRNRVVLSCLPKES